MGFTIVQGEDGLVRVEFDDQSFTDVMRRYVDTLQDENDQLRELVRDMVHWMPCQRPCGHCERYRYPEGCEFASRWRELEVVE